MKAYLMSLPKSLKGISDKLNVKALLCEKSWLVFHEEKRVIFIFQKDGSLIVSQNGVASKGKWEYIKSNKTILIEAVDTMLLLRPIFVDDVLFVLQQDGVGYFVFIDERRIDKFVQKTISAIDDYLKEVSGEAQKMRETLEQERREKERQRRLLARERAEEEIVQATKELKKKHKKSVVACLLIACLSVLLCFMITPAFVLLFVFMPLAMDSIVGKIDDQIEEIEKVIVSKHLQQIKDSNEIPD